MTTPTSALTRSPSAAWQTRRAPRTKSFAAWPEEGTTATISPAARAALAAATTATTPPEAPSQPAAEAHRTAAPPSGRDPAA